MATPPPLKLPDYVSVVPAYADSMGNVVGAPHALFTGPGAAFTERIIDNRRLKESLTVLNDAASVRKSQDARERDLDVREAALAEREEAMAAAELEQAIGKMDALVNRIDAYEVERAKDPDDNDHHALSPGIDTGELESPKDAPTEDPDAPRVPAAMED